MIRRARAAIIIDHGRIIGYRMRDGSVACVKVRYHDEATAQKDLARISALPTLGHKPVRVYSCPYCSGFHTTSRPNVITRY